MFNTANTAKSTPALKYRKTAICFYVHVYNDKERPSTNARQLRRSYLCHASYPLSALDLEKDYMYCNNKYLNNLAFSNIFIICRDYTDTFW